MVMMLTIVASAGLTFDTGCLALVHRSAKTKGLDRIPSGHTDSLLTRFLFRVKNTIKIVILSSPLRRTVKRSLKRFLCDMFCQFTSAYG